MQHKVFISCPGSSLSFGAAMSLGSNKHQVEAVNTTGSWDTFNVPWCCALNNAADGRVTHFAMIHSDIRPQPDWIDVLLDEMDRLDADLISVPIALKDSRGCTSSGIGDPNCNWHPLRRFTIRDLGRLPTTFSAADAGHADSWLLHNNGLWIADLRKPLWNQVNERGELKAFFDFPRRVIKRDGLWTSEGESEDWYFSRQIAALGAKTFICRKVKAAHIGSTEFPNFGDWGQYDRDEDTRVRSSANEHVCDR